MLNRRSLLQVMLAGAGVSLVDTLKAQEVANASETLNAPAFVKPTATHPLLLCYNENPIGMSPKAKQAAAKSLSVANRYAFARCEVLRNDVAAYMGGKPENIMLSHGSSEAIRACIEAFSFHKPDTQLLVPELTYGDGEAVARRNAIPVARCLWGRIGRLILKR